MRKLIALLIITFMTVTPVMGAQSVFLTLVATVSNGFVGTNTTSNCSPTTFSSDRGYYGDAGYTPESIGVVSYGHIEISNANGANAVLALYDSSNTLVAETDVFAQSNAELHVPLLAEYTLTNQTYYCVFGTSNWGNVAGVSGEGQDYAEMQSYTITSVPTTLSNTGNRASNQSPRIWFTNTADGS